MNYRKASDEFVMTAFSLLDRYKADPNSTYCRWTMLIKLALDYPEIFLIEKD